MAILLAIYAWFLAHGLIILGALLATSEALALIPGVAANSVFQAVVNGVRWIKAQIFPGSP